MMNTLIIHLLKLKKNLGGLLSFNKYSKINKVLLKTPYLLKFNYYKRRIFNGMYSKQDRFTEKAN